jgi:hypothetical protein
MMDIGIKEIILIFILFAKAVTILSMTTWQDTSTIQDEVVQSPSAIKGR